MKDRSREGEVGFKTAKPNFQTIHSTQYLTPSSYVGLFKVVQNDDTKALQSSQTSYLLMQDRVERSSTRGLPSDTSRVLRMSPYHSQSTPLMNILGGVWAFSHCASRGYPACASHTWRAVSLGNMKVTPRKTW